MSDTKMRIITADNMQTVIAVCFVLGLLSLALNFYAFSLVHQVTIGVGNLQVDTNARIATLATPEQVTALESRLGALEAKVSELEAKAVPPPVVP
jgi:hypothetical protein